MRRSSSGRSSGGASTARKEGHWRRCWRWLRQSRRQRASSPFKQQPCPDPWSTFCERTPRWSAAPSCANGRFGRTLRACVKLAGPRHENVRSCVPQPRTGLRCRRCATTGGDVDAASRACDLANPVSCVTLPDVFSLHLSEFVAHVMSIASVFPHLSATLAQHSSSLVVAVTESSSSKALDSEWSGNGSTRFALQQTLRNTSGYPCSRHCFTPSLNPRIARDRPLQSLRCPPLSSCYQQHASPDLAS